MAGPTALPVAAPLGRELTDRQIGSLLDAVVNPMGRVTVAGRRRHEHVLALRRPRWRANADSSDRRC